MNVLKMTKSGVLLFCFFHLSDRESFPETADCVSEQEVHSPGQVQEEPSIYQKCGPWVQDSQRGNCHKEINNFLGLY